MFNPGLSYWMMYHILSKKNSKLGSRIKIPQLLPRATGEEGTAVVTMPWLVMPSVKKAKCCCFGGQQALFLYAERQRETSYAWRKGDNFGRSRWRVTPNNPSQHYHVCASDHCPSVHISISPVLQWGFAWPITDLLIVLHCRKDFSTLCVNTWEKLVYSSSKVMEIRRN